MAGNLRDDTGRATANIDYQQQLQAIRSRGQQNRAAINATERQRGQNAARMGLTPRSARGMGANDPYNQGLASMKTPNIPGLDAGMARLGADLQNRDSSLWRTAQANAIPGTAGLFGSEMPTPDDLSRGASKIQSLVKVARTSSLADQGRIAKQQGKLNPNSFVDYSGGGGLFGQNQRTTWDRPSSMSYAPGRGLADARQPQGGQLPQGWNREISYPNGAQENVRYSDGAGGYMEGLRPQMAQGGGFSVAGRGLPSDMTQEQWNGLSQDQRTGLRVGQINQDIAAMQDLNATRRQAAGYGPQQGQGLGGYQQNQGFTTNQPDWNTAMQDYLSGRVGSEGYGMIRNLMMQADSRDPGRAEAAQGMLQGLGKGLTGMMEAGQEGGLRPSDIAAMERNQIDREQMQMDQQQFSQEMAADREARQQQARLQYAQLNRPQGLRIFEQPTEDGGMMPMVYGSQGGQPFAMPFEELMGGSMVDGYR